MELFDIERVEVLRGPQGTLYGKNTIGGAYSVITRRPGQDAHALGQLTIGDYNQHELRAAASGPVSDTVALGGAFFAATRDGYVTNPVTGEEYNNRNVWGARVQGAWDVTPNFSLDVAADYSEEDNAITMGQPISTLVSFAGATPIGVVPTPPPEYDFTGQATPGLPNSSIMDHSGVSVRASWELTPNWTLNSISAYRDLNYEDYVDIDATQFEFGDVFVGVDQDQVSQELQAIYEGERLTLVSGLYYLQENITSHQEAYGDDLVNGYFGQSSFLRTVDDDLQTTSIAAYANASYAITDRLNLGFGARYSEEDKEYDRSTSTFWTSPGFNSTVAFTIDDTWDNFSPMVSLDYQAQDNILLYARVAQGFKSGGFNGRANNPGEDAPYDPETVTSYEIGAQVGMVRQSPASPTSRRSTTTIEDFQARVSGTCDRIRS